MIYDSDHYGYYISNFIILAGINNADAATNTDAV
jgi:hypothetical protein